MRGWGRCPPRASSVLPPCCPAGSATCPRGAGSPRPAGTACSAWTFCPPKVSLGETPLEAAAAAPRINPAKASPLPLTLVECNELSRARCVCGLPHLKRSNPSCRWIASTLSLAHPSANCFPLPVVIYLNVYI